MALNIKPLFPLDHPIYSRPPAPNMGLRAECEAFNTQKDEREKRPALEYYRALDHLWFDSSLSLKNKKEKKQY
ncbi:hypothetical protein M899_1641 [Bacteriovorax sp. BSW11_IV]|uniref:hypothetical protein n=1 Tax=Bacteriovorax sp. BSW11_IV TaxID=1353529 RepID=UPI00038A1632|nr:hypothetical protein [Bacteriovorax sp. BSW11_IV]EQC49310.1 hypothetical protein M899_1641 [Bacteriovorax sp. BSW11_IV]